MEDHFAVLEDILHARFSCRAFKPDPVPEETITDLVRAAGRSASWCNAQPWTVTITKGAETDRFREALLDVAEREKPAPDMPWPESYPGVYGERRRTCGYQLYQAVGIARDDYAARGEQSMRNFHFFDAPHAAIVHAPAELGPYGAMDCGGFVAAFMMAATSLGVGTIAQASVAAYPDMIRTHFGLEEERRILCAISFGYVDDSHPSNGFRTERAQTQDILDLRG